MWLDGLYKCADKSVTACIKTESGVMYWGMNLQRVAVDFCPRAVGDGYELCQSICKQVSHAEIAAIKKWREAGAVLPAVIYVSGANKICSDCMAAIVEVGLTLELLKCVIL